MLLEDSLGGCRLHNLANGFFKGAPGRNRWPLYLEIVAVQDFRTAFCINCGATVDIGELVGSMGASARENVRLVFIDSHRPIHHSLNDDQDQNHVLLHNPDGGDIPLDSIPLADSALREGATLPASLATINTGMLAQDRINMDFSASCWLW